MTAIRTRQAANGLALALLLAAALFMQAIVPSGYMPERAETGFITVGICHSGAVMHIPLGPQDQDPADPAANDPLPCTFAALGFATWPPGGALAVPHAVAVRAFATGEAPFALSHARRQQPPARGPPQSV